MYINTRHIQYSALRQRNVILMFVTDFSVPQVCLTCISFCCLINYNFIVIIILYYYENALDIHIAAWFLLSALAE